MPNEDTKEKSFSEEVEKEVEIEKHEIAPHQEEAQEAIAPEHPKSADEQIKKEMENLEADDSLHATSSLQASQAVSPEQQKKIESLLEIAKKKGVAEAVEAAKKMNDAYILDIFHDTLAKEGYYQKFGK